MLTLKGISNSWKRSLIRKYAGKIEVVSDDSERSDQEICDEENVKIWSGKVIGCRRFCTLLEMVMTAVETTSSEDKENKKYWWGEDLELYIDIINVPEMA